MYKYKTQGYTLSVLNVVLMNMKKIDKIESKDFKWKKFVDKIEKGNRQNWRWKEFGM